MKNFRALMLFIFFLILGLMVYYCNNPNNTSPEKEPPAIFKISLKDGHPFVNFTDTQMISYLGFDLLYVEKYEQAVWVAYIFTKSEALSDSIIRTNNFRNDTNIRTKSSSLDDYKKSGYDRGHLAPAADMRWSDQAMSESFLMSNISPQKPSFNRGIWKKLESTVRKWAIENDSIIVITGPIFINNKGTIGKNKVVVPGKYFKVIMDISPPEYKGIAFIIPNETGAENVFNYSISIDSLEHLTHYDFFPNVKDKRIVEIEKRLDIERWK